MQEYVEVFSNLNSEFLPLEKLEEISQDDEAMEGDGKVGGGEELN